MLHRLKLGVAVAALVPVTFALVALPVAPQSAMAAMKKSATKKGAAMKGGAMKGGAMKGGAMKSGKGAGDPLAPAAGKKM